MDVKEKHTGNFVYFVILVNKDLSFVALSLHLSLSHWALPTVRLCYDHNMEAVDHGLTPGT